MLNGLWGLKDTDRVTAQNIEEVMTAVNYVRDQHNATMDAILPLFAERTTRHQRRFYQGETANLQAIDETGRARPVKPSGHYDVAFPIQMAGFAWGWDFVTRQKMTVEMVGRQLALVMNADKYWMRTHVLSALLSYTTWTYQDKDEGALTVQPLALTGDGVTYPRRGTATTSTDEHFYAQAAAIDNSNDPFDTLYTEISEHPENDGPYIALCPSNIVSAIKGLSAFNPVSDANVRPGSGTDTLVGTLGVTVPGEVFGYHDERIWLVEWADLPSGYGVVVGANGPRPLAMREDEEEQLRGFNLVAEREDHPFTEAQWVRRAGFGANNRVGAVAFRIGNATYSAPPTGYAAPIP